MLPTLIRLNDAAADPGLVGGKAANLASLLQHGLPVPAGWVIPVEVFNTHLSANNLVEQAEAAFAGGDVGTHCASLSVAIHAIALQQQLLDSLSCLPETSFAVRSSASVEDGSTGSYSGIFHSALGVDRRRLPEAIKQVWASVFTPGVVSYHLQMSPESGFPRMAVLIMPLLDAQISGVAFSADPADGNSFRICITACRGLATRIVDGTEAGAKYVLDLDSLQIITASFGYQAKGDFLQAHGEVATRTVGAEIRLSGDELRSVGSAVCAIDEALDARVDVELAFADDGLVILQARPLLGLPAYFPDDPSGESCGTQHSTWSDPLPTLVQDVFSGPMKHEGIPRPPWPLEGELFWCVHGRAFGSWDPDLDENERKSSQFPESHFTFLRDMEGLDDPEQYFQRYHTWTEMVYQTVVPRLRQASTALLSSSRDELAALAPRSLADLFQKAVDLERQAHVLYVSCSGPTSWYPDITEQLLQDWLDLPRLPPRVYSSPAQQLAMEMIQGAPTLVHERDSWLQQIALGEGDLDEFINHWGYSYLVRDEQIYLHCWKSWQEDPQPVVRAAEQMQQAADQGPLSEKLAASRQRAEECLSRTIDNLRARFPHDHDQRIKILQACVRFGRAHFRMKDDRDLVWSHAQAALRWVLTEVARRLVVTGGLVSDDDVFLLNLKELSGLIVEKHPVPAKVSAVVEERRREQRRLARMSGVLQGTGEAPAPPEGNVMIGIPTGTGIAEGKAHIVHEATALPDLARLEDGDVLVFIGEGKVGLTMFFPQIAGLVYSGGNGFSHEVNILRELGKPAIVSLWENAGLIKEGEQLRIDASNGTLTRLDECDG